jgi:hypothetical protein
MYSLLARFFDFLCPHGPLHRRARTELEQGSIATSTTSQNKLNVLLRLGDFSPRDLCSKVEEEVCSTKDRFRMWLWWTAGQFVRLGEIRVNLLLLLRHKRGTTFSVLL